jgi:hypothetical protein
MELPMSNQEPNAESGGVVVRPGAAIPIKIAGPPRKAKPANTATPFLLPLNERPSSAWAHHFQSVEWRKLDVPQTPVLEGDVIRIAWIEHEETMFKMLDGIKAAIEQVNEAQQAVLDRWWSDQEAES